MWNGMQQWKNGHPFRIDGQSADHGQSADPSSLGNGRKTRALTWQLWFAVRVVDDESLSLELVVLFVDRMKKLSSL